GAASSWLGKVDSLEAEGDRFFKLGNFAGIKDHAAGEQPNAMRSGDGNQQDAEVKDAGLPASPVHDVASNCSGSSQRPRRVATRFRTDQGACRARLASWYWVGELYRGDLPTGLGLWAQLRGQCAAP